MILLWMIFLHIVDDYYLQGILAKLKQRKWWTSQKEYSDKYKNDYIVGLVTHGFSWGFMIHIPFMIIGVNSVVLIVSIVTNSIIHSIIDDAKANRFKINLIQDQLLHLVQIVIVFTLYMFFKEFI